MEPRNNYALRPLVSVCMPAYNAGKYIGEAIKALIGQTYANWELIIVNDGSTDDTAAVLQNYSDKRIQVYHQDNKGQCAAANRAFGYAKGSLIKFSDADDLISPDFLKNQVEKIAGEHEAIAVSSWGRFYDDNLATFTLNSNVIEHDTAPIEWLAANMAAGRQGMMQCGLWLIPKEILLKSGLWNESLSLINDYEFFIRVLLHAKKICFTPDAILYYRSGLGNSLSGSKSQKHIESAFNSIHWGNQHLLDFEDSPRIRQIAANNLLYLIYEVYPAFPVLVQAAEQKVKLLGSGNIPFPAGGYTRLLAKALGWKLAKRLRNIKR